MKGGLVVTTDKNKSFEEKVSLEKNLSLCIKQVYKMKHWFVTLCVAIGETCWSTGQSVLTFRHLEWDMCSAFPLMNSCFFVTMPMFVLSQIRFL